jgi:hypothetical protein
VTHRRGVTDVPGVYFLGLLWQHTRGSALLGWVKDDAQFIAQRIGAFAQDHATSSALLASEAGSLWPPSPWASHDRSIRSDPSDGPSAPEVC